jgi:hypothetical protein
MTLIPLPLYFSVEQKPDGIGAAYQQWIPTGEQSGLPTRIAATGSVSLYEPMKS